MLIIPDQALGNYSATAATYSLSGTKVWSNSAAVNTAADASSNVFAITAGTSTPYFLDLKLKDGSGNLVSKNFYWLPSDGATNISSMLSMAKTTMPATANATWTKSGTENTVSLKIVNTGTVCAMSCRLLLTGATSGNRILPVHFNDNYFSLIPGDTQSVIVKFDDVDLNNEIAEVMPDRHQCRADLLHDRVDPDIAPGNGNNNRPDGRELRFLYRFQLESVQRAC